LTKQTFERFYGATDWRADFIRVGSGPRLASALIDWEWLLRGKTGITQEQT